MLSSPQNRYNAMNLSSKKSYPMNTFNLVDPNNPATPNNPTTPNNPSTTSSPDSTLTPASSIYYSNSYSDSASSPNPDLGPDENSNLSPIKSTLAPSISKSINASPQQIIDAVNSFIMKLGIFNDISIRFIDQNMAESNGTFTKDVDTLIKNYPGFASFKTYLKLAAGKNIYATTKIVVDKNNQLIPSFESLYIGIFPIPTGFINNKLKDKGPEFTNAVKSALVSYIATSACR